MHATIHALFERLVATHGPFGTVLEIGAMAEANTLLNLPALAGATEKCGINLDPQPDPRILTGSANAMPGFADGRFDLVICNSVLEHDAYFWLTLAEMQRVLRPGGIAMLGVPGYADRSGGGKRLATLASRLWRADWPGGAWIAGLAASTPVLQVHNYPADYYRFSAQAMRDVFLEGLEVLAIEQAMLPPRIIGVGRKR